MTSITSNPPLGDFRHPILFLDIDEVMVSRQSAVPNMTADEELQLNRHSVMLLDWVCRETNAKVVISSFWRVAEHRSLIWWNQFFNKSYSAPNINVIGCTDRMPSHTRGEEINSWWRVNGSSFSDYLIIDDSNDFYEWQKPKHVRPEAVFGFQYQHALFCLLTLQPTHPLASQLADELLDVQDAIARMQVRLPPSVVSLAAQRQAEREKKNHDDMLHHLVCHGIVERFAADADVDSWEMLPVADEHYEFSMGKTTKQPSYYESIKPIATTDEFWRAFEVFYSYPPTTKNHGQLFKVVSG